MRLNRGDIWYRHHQTVIRPPLISAFQNLLCVGCLRQETVGIPEGIPFHETVGWLYPDHQPPPQQQSLRAHNTTVHQHVAMHEWVHTKCACMNYCSRSNVDVPPSTVSILGPISSHLSINSPLTYIYAKHIHTDKIESVTTTPIFRR
ncbi:hypothetical protein ABW21_db0201233 [Orbilia brochopaga]|nr:hypothetical protein ABW21_db0201233 [Drechslerella brochopaga]